VTAAQVHLKEEPEQLLRHTADGAAPLGHGARHQPLVGFPVDRLTTASSPAHLTVHISTAPGYTGVVLQPVLVGELPFTPSGLNARAVCAGLTHQTPGIESTPRHLCRLKPEAQRA